MIKNESICLSTQGLVHEYSYQLLVITKKCKQPILSPKGEWLNKLWYTYAMEYHSGVKKNTLWTQETSMNLKISVLSIRRQTKIIHII